ncbi:MAG: HTH domain-containing protein [Firmicutes bacterium]|nr:HTH domain-containing protein [Bacillota bacterium]
MKTIAQIAKELGVSRQAVYKKIKKEPLLTSLQGLTVLVNNKLTVDTDGEAIIKIEFDKNVSTVINDNTVNMLTMSTEKINKVSTKVDNIDDELPQSLHEQIKLLNSQIDLKDTLIQVLQNELKYKNEQIQELTSTIRIQAESINAVHKNELAETIIDGQQAIMPEISKKTDQEKKQSLFKRLFKR